MISRLSPQSIMGFVRRFNRPQPAPATRHDCSKNLTRRAAAVRWLAGLALLMAVIVGASTAKGQEDRKRKIPVVDKITGGSNRQAFSGKVEMVDMKRHVLEVNHAEGTGMEIFPIKNGVNVSSAAGDRMKLEQLKQGSNVIVYYDVKDDKRSVREIVVLAPGSTDDPKKKTSPPS